MNGIFDGGSFEDVKSTVEVASFTLYRCLLNTQHLPPISIEQQDLSLPNIMATQANNTAQESKDFAANEEVTNESADKAYVARQPFFCAHDFLQNTDLYPASRTRRPLTRIPTTRPLLRSKETRPAHTSQLVDSRSALLALPQTP